jgi:predicted RecB family nuclease
MGMNLTEKLAEKARTWQQIALAARREAEEFDRQAQSILAQRYVGIEPNDPYHRYNAEQEQAKREQFEKDKQTHAFVPKQAAAAARAKAEHYETKASHATGQGLLYHDARSPYDGDMTGDYAALFREANDAHRVKFAGAPGASAPLGEGQAAPAPGPAATIA